MTFGIKHLKNGTSIVYGFNADKIKFQMVMTLEREKDTIIVHGFLSVGELTALNLLTLYKFLSENLEEKYLECQVVPEHAKIYKKFLHVIKSEKSKTFNGHDCELLLIDMRKDIKFLKG